MLKLKLQYFGLLMQRADSFEKTLMLGKIEGGRRRGWKEDEMVGWHHQLNGHEFGWTPAVGDRQRGPACCSPWGRGVEHDWATELNWTEYSWILGEFFSFWWNQWVLLTPFLFFFNQRPAIQICFASTECFSNLHPCLCSISGNYQLKISTNWRVNPQKINS